MMAPETYEIHNNQWRIPSGLGGGVERPLACQTERRRRPTLNPLTPTFAMDTAIKHPVPDRVKPSFVIFDISSALSVRVSGCQKLQMTA